MYLIFSANKSGEYFGYARMTSSINDASASSIDWTPKAQSSDALADLPKAIPTPATEHAPKGRIIDDSARGTIFWEADSDDGDVSSSLEGGAVGDGSGDDDLENASDKASDPSPSPDAITAAADAAAAEDSDSFLPASVEKSWGKPFRIAWVSTARVPFYRTRGLRNSWNANREVKIARDGTELETSVGARLVLMFHRGGPSPPVPAGVKGDAVGGGGSDGDGEGGKEGGNKSVFNPLQAQQVRGA